MKLTALLAAVCLVAVTASAQSDIRAASDGVQKGGAGIADTIHHIDEVVVVQPLTMRETIPSTVLKGDQLRRLSALSVADALRYFSGLQLKDYGGVGGVKTVNIRSMGTHHLGIFYDGVELGNAQNGQIDL